MARSCHPAALSRLLFISLFVGVAIGEKVTLLELPDKRTSAWTWDWSEFGNKDVWQTNSYPEGGVTKIQQVACDGLPSGQPNSWLRSDDVFVRDAKRIEISVTYTARNCSAISNPAHCGYDFDVFAHQSKTRYRSDRIPNPYMTPASYSKVGTFTAKSLKYHRRDVALNTASLSLVLENATSYVYFALHYRGGCIGVLSLTVSYYRCSQMALSTNLITLPLTVAPINGSQMIKGNCVQHSQPLTNVDDLYGYCQSDGEWSTAMYHGKCLCIAGYEKTTQGSSGSACTACPSGEYKNTASNNTCITCPSNSIQEWDRTSCRCSDGFYRAAIEPVTFNCTAPPTAPQNLRKTFITATVVTMDWSEPANTGGRSDLSYEVECKICSDNGSVCTTDCSNDVMKYLTTINLNVTLATIKHLSAYTYYKFKVYARNGVSPEAEKNNDKAKFQELLARTKESVPGIPVISVIKRLSSTSVFLRWSVKAPNGVITYYQVTYYTTDKPHNKYVFNTTDTNATISPLQEEKQYCFEVRAGSRLGLGAPSKTKNATMTDIKEPFLSWEIVAGIAGAAGALFILIVLIVICCIHRKRRERRRKQNESRQVLEMGHDMLPVNGQRMYIDPSNYGDPMEALKCIDAEIDRRRIKLESIIGGGEFAEVYKGIFKMGSEPETVAVKILKVGSSRKNCDDFFTEASIMGQFKHPNVIALKGVVTRSKPWMIVTEFMENGSLDHFLKGHDGKLTILQLIGMARGVVAGMAYLSGINFIHRDLAARNVLVSDNLATKVADFGLSRELDDKADNPESEYETQGGKIPVRWTAPEAIRYRKFSSASDVWSYGVLLWEIMSFSDRPYWGWDNFQVMDRVECGYRLPAPMNCPKVIHNLMLDCWHKEKNSRPKFPDIIPRLDELIRSPEKLQDDFAGTYSMSRAVDTNFEEVQSVREWLDSINMGRYADDFTNHGYMDLSHVRNLEEEDLSKIGIKLIGHRNKIRKSIKAMNKYFEATEENNM